MKHLPGSERKKFLEYESTLSGKLSQSQGNKIHEGNILAQKDAQIAQLVNKLQFCHTKVD